MSEKQELFESMLNKICDSVLRDMDAPRGKQEARAELRDRFAMAALEGLLASGDVHTYNRDIRAVMAWQEADAMLKARGE